MNSADNSLKIMIGMINESSLVVDRTPNISLNPGTNRLGFVTLEWRRVWKNYDLSAFGPFFNVIIIGFYVCLFTR